MTDTVSGNFIDIHNPALDIFKPTPRDESIIEYQFTEMLNKDGSDLANRDGLTQYEIFNNDRDTWMALADSYLECRFKIVPNADRAQNFNRGNIAFVNNALNLFRRAEYYIDNKLVESYEQPGIVEQVKGLIEYSEDSEKQMSSELWYPDRGNGATGHVLPPLTPVTLTAAGAATTLAAAANGKLAVGAGANDAAIVFVWNGVNLTSVIGYTAAALAPEKDGAGAGDPINAVGVAAGTGLNLRIVAADPTTQLQLFTVVDGKMVKLFINGDGGPHFAVYSVENGAIVGAAIPAGQIYAYVASEYDESALLNTGFQSRKLKSYTPSTGLYNKIVTAKIPLRKLFKFFDYNRILLKGVVHRILLFRNDQERMLYRDARTDYTGHAVPNQDGRVVMHHLSWWVPRVLPNREWEQALNSQISAGKTVSLGWHEFEHFTNPTTIRGDGVGGAPGSINWKIHTVTKKPVRAYVFFQRTDAITSQLVNNMVFPAVPVGNIYLKVNGLRYPLEDYKCNFVNLVDNGPQHTRLYEEFLKAGKHEHAKHTGPCISYEEFVSLYQVFCFDMTAQDNAKIWQSQTTADIEVYASFTDVFPNVGGTYTVHAILECQKYMNMSGVNNKLDVLI